MFQSSGKQPAKNQPPKTVRLPKQPGILQYADLQFLMQEAEKMKGRIVEFPFTSADRKIDYVLSAQCYPKEIDPSGTMDPEWVLTEYGAGQPRLLWRHPTRDLSLMSNMIAGESGGDQLQDIVPTSALFGGTQNPIGGATGAYTPVGSGSGGGGGGASLGGGGFGSSSIMFEPPRPGAKATLEGDLAKLQVPNLLQSINLAKMTGRLDVRTRSEQAEVFFQEGNLVHCRVRETTGDNAIVELVCWSHGEFRFWPDERTDQRTCQKRLDSLLMEGVALLDQSKYLEQAGLKIDSSCLVKKNAMISEEEFQARVSKGAPIALEPQLDFYELVDNRNTLAELLKKRPMPMTEWTPILFNLVSCGLVTITDQAPAQDRLARLKALGIDDNALQSVIKNLNRSETGILTYDAFIYFLDQEYLRYEYFNTPFSIVIFSLGQRKGGESGPVESLQMLAVRRAMQRIQLIKRHVDYLGHYEMFDFGVILPNTNAAAAYAFANRTSEVLREAPLSSDMDSRNLLMAFGVATIPEDCVDLDKLLISAKKARDHAKQYNKRVVLARDLPQSPQ